MRLIYFDIDTLRHDHLSCYGYVHKTPNIDALANDGVRFDAAYSSNTPCIPARAAIFTGCFGVVNGIETHGENALKVNTPKQTSLASVLSSANIRTATVSSFGRHPAPWFYDGFCTVTDPSYITNASNFQRFSGAAVNDAAIEILYNHKSDNLFLHLHYWDPHGPLNPPQEWLDATPLPDTSRIPNSILKKLCTSRLYRAGVHSNIYTREDLSKLLRLYDAEIAYTDYLIGQMCNFLKANNMYDDSLIILSSDHGEQYGEAQMILEHGSVHESCIHIPLILKFVHNRLSGTACKAPVYGLDIAPTAAEHFGITPLACWNGTSLQHTLKGLSKQREYLICEHGLYTCQRAVLHKGWKMVHTFNRGIWDFAQFALYNLENDYCETQNLKSENPDMFKKLCEFERLWLKELNLTEDILAQMGAKSAQYGLRVANKVTLELSDN